MSIIFAKRNTRRINKPETNEISYLINNPEGMGGNRVPEQENRYISEHIFLFSFSFDSRFTCSNNQKILTKIGRRIKFNINRQFIFSLQQIDIKITQKINRICSSKF